MAKRLQVLKDPECREIQRAARSRLLNRREAIQPAFDALLGIAASARDAVHLAVMERHGIERILSFDSGFDGFPGVSRLS